MKVSSNFKLRIYSLFFYYKKYRFICCFYTNFYLLLKNENLT